VADKLDVIGEDAAAIVESVIKEAQDKARSF
jgi:hypothetical protein